MDCLNCVFSDCINDSDVLTASEREMARKTDKSILNSRGLTYSENTRHKSDDLHKKAQRKYFHRKYYLKDPEKHRRLARLSYARNKEKRLASSHNYYKTHREEILSNKKTYYQENREKILEKRKKDYVPRERILIDTPEAELKRQRARESYQRNKEEINRRRKERRLNASNKRQQTTLV